MIRSNICGLGVLIKRHTVHHVASYVRQRIAGLSSSTSVLFQARTPCKRDELHIQHPDALPTQPCMLYQSTLEACCRSGTISNCYSVGVWQDRNSKQHRPAQNPRRASIAQDIPLYCTVRQHTSHPLSALSKLSNRSKLARATLSCLQWSRLGTHHQIRSQDSNGGRQMPLLQQQCRGLISRRCPQCPGMRP